MLRVFAACIQSPLLCGTFLELSSEESHHLLKVRRAKEGEAVQLLDGKGMEATAELARITGRTAILKILSITNTPALPYSITLAQAIPAGGTMDTIVQKATELGVTRIVPILSRNCEVKLDANRSRQKVAKWQTIATESCKQCGNPWLPEISPPTSLQSYLVQETAPIRLTAALTPDTREIRTAIRNMYGTNSPISIALLIGPEGDFTPEEYASCWQHQWHPVTLGPNVLRADTAATAAVTLIMYELRLQDSEFTTATE